MEKARQLTGELKDELNGSADFGRTLSVTRGRALLFLMTALVFVVFGLALSGYPPPVWVPLVLAVAYLAVIFWGVMSLSLQMFGDAICEAPLALGKVALTFDDGPDPVSTRLTLDLLREAGARATFFLVGNKAARHPEIVRNILKEGHSLGIHSYGHNRLYAFLPPSVVKQDIEKTRDAIEAAAGVRPFWFRPPVGQMSPRTVRGVQLASAQTVGWSIRAFDGVRSARPEDCADRVMSKLDEGAIVLMHDAWEKEEVQASEEKDETLGRCPAGVRALRQILSECSRRGLECVTVEELLASEEQANINDPKPVGD